MTLRSQGHPEQEGGRWCGGPGLTLLAREKGRPHQGVLPSNWLVGGSMRPSQAMKEAFQRQPRGSENTPRKGCVNMSQAPQALHPGPWGCSMV